jgi:hypothetical protein
MRPFLRIIRIPYEEPYHVHLVLEASNGESLGLLEFYDNASALKTWADALENFPRHSSDVFLYELGSERPEDRFAHYFRFRAFTTDGLGHCAVQLRMNNNSALPYRNVSEFCICAEAADINRLGALCRKFALLQHDVLYWRLTEGELYESLEEAEEAHVRYLMSSSLSRRLRSL